MSGEDSSVLMVENIDLKAENERLLAEILKLAKEIESISNDNDSLRAELKAIAQQYNDSIQRQNALVAVIADYQAFISTVNTRMKENSKEVKAN
jgi:chromosome segregation ATPase